ncbi:hypothetical protein [Bifidobacterium simiarum]|uniref:hypothetical protein n=1 Tax=Bifidobacterium simiarum TaxID=2045441 RepID=UPI001BDD8DEF|nr:hypothetical protein [Bifidobacterium simiarum]MBT1165192.1 hypothetical protein [Bifidobacterium simiarum]
MSVLFSEAQDAFINNEYQRAYDLFNQAASEDPNDIRADYLKYITYFHIDPVEGFNKLDEINSLTNEYIKLFMIDSNSDQVKSVLINEILIYLASLAVHLAETAGESFNNEEVSGATLISLLGLLSQFIETRYTSTSGWQTRLSLDSGMHMLQEAEKIVLKTVSNARSLGVGLSPEEEALFANTSESLGLAADFRETKWDSVTQTMHRSVQTHNQMPAAIYSDLEQIFGEYKVKIDEYLEHPLQHINDLENLHVDLQELISVFNEAQNIPYRKRSDILQEILAGYCLLALKMQNQAMEHYCDSLGRVYDAKLLSLRDTMAKIAHCSCLVAFDFSHLMQKYPRIQEFLNSLCQNTDAAIVIGYRDTITVSGEFLSAPTTLKNLMIELSKLLSSVWKEINPASCLSDELLQAIEQNDNDSFTNNSVTDQAPNKWQKLCDENDPLKRYRS